MATCSATAALTWYESGTAGTAASIVANANVIPANGSGSFDVFVTDNTWVIIDINGYYTSPSTLALGAGTSAAPALTFSNDTNSGLYSPAAGTVTIASGGNDGLTVNSSGASVNGNLTVGTGNVGIGESTGLSRLTVIGKATFTATGTVTTNGTTTVTGTGTKFLSEIGIGDRIQIPAGTGPTTTVSAVLSDISLVSVTSVASGSGQSMGVLPSPFRVDTAANSTALRVTDSGSVQIGTVASLTSSSLKLLMQAANPFSGTSTTVSTATSGESVPNVLVRSSTPEAADIGPLLGFSGWTNASATTGITLLGGIRGAKENGTTGDFNGYLGFYTTQASTNTFAERMRISSGGNVGIGTTIPTTALHVATGDAYVANAGSGLIVKSPDGTKCARIALDNTGALAATSLACP